MAVNLLVAIAAVSSQWVSSQTEPVTILAVMVGSKFGIQRGFAFAILVTLASNSVLGQVGGACSKSSAGLGCSIGICCQGPR